MMMFITEYPVQFLLKRRVRVIEQMFDIKQIVPDGWGWLGYDKDHVLICAKDDDTAIKIKLAS